jgi:hypothetical protein
VFSPRGPNLFVGRELATFGCRLRSSNGGTLLGRESYGGSDVVPCKLKEDARNVVLSVGREAAYRFKRSL